MAKENLGKIMMSVKGAYSSTIAYEFLDVVSYNGSSYVCKTANTGKLPTDGNYWVLIAQKGDNPVPGEDYFTEADREELRKMAVNEVDVFYNDILNALPSETVSGTDITVTDAKECRFIKSNIKGKCIQDGTPSPTAPVEIVTADNKNFLPFPYVDTTKTVNGVTFTVNKDRSITVNGTAAGGNASFKLYGTYNNQVSLEHKYFTCGINSSQLVMRAINYNNGAYTIIVSTSNTNRVAELDLATYKEGYYELTLYNGNTVDNVTVRPMLIDDPTKTKYALYPNGVSVETNSKNLIEPIMATTTVNGITCTNNGDGTFTLNGTATGNADFRVNQQTSGGINNLKTYNGDYTLSCNELITGVECNVMQFNTWNRPLKTTSSKKYASANINNMSDMFVYLYVHKDTTLNNLTVKPMLEEGNTVTTWAPYQHNSAPISLKGEELCSIGDVKDEVIIESNKVKILKRIGKVVLDGVNNKLTHYGAYGTENAPLFYIEGLNIVINKTYKDTIVISNSYVTYTIDSDTAVDMPNYNIRGATSNSRVYLRDDRFTDNASINNWLSTNPVTVYYVLATPVEVEVGYIDTLPMTFDGTTHINVEANVEDVELDVKYAQDIKLLINK